MGQQGDCAHASIPTSDASWQEMLDFAITYDGYRRVAATPRDLDMIVRPVLEELASSGTPPSWAGIDLLRAALFYLQRAERWSGDLGPDTEHRFRVLIGAIREASDGLPLPSDARPD